MTALVPKWVSFSLYLALAATTSAAEGPARTEKAAASKSALPLERYPPVRVTISRETTHITSPLAESGYVDYVAALDQHFKKGVTPQNNAAVLMWKVTGPGAINAKSRDEYCRKLGIAPLPEKGDYFLTLDQYRKTRKDLAGSETNPDEKKQEDIWKEFSRATKRPWSAKELPLFADWLKANEKPLALAVEASRRPRRDDPLLGGKDQMVLAVLLPGVQSYREVAAALCLRAMLRLNQGQVEQAWDDLLACHRLARLAGQGQTLIDALVGIALEAIACAGDQALIQSDRLSAAQARKIQEDLDKLSALPQIADKIDLAERFMFLDCVQVITRRGISTLNALSGEPSSRSTTGKMLQSVVDWLGQVFIDWDLILRMGNSWFDRIVEALRLPTLPQRKQALGEIDRNLRQARVSIMDPESFNILELADPQKAVSERVGKILLSLLTPAFLKVADAENRGTMLHDLDRLAFALAAYHGDHGSYPAKLADLAPRYLRRVPRDIFSDQDLHYRRESSGFLLYSVGVNGRDDGGKSYDDRTSGQDWDDLVVRVPAKKIKP